MINKPKKDCQDIANYKAISSLTRQCEVRAIPHLAMTLDEPTIRLC